MHQIIVMLWLAVIPVKDGIVAFPPPARAFTSQGQCKTWLKTIPNAKEGDYVCAPIFVIKGEPINNAKF